MREKHLMLRCPKCGSNDLIPLGNSPSMISRLLNPLVEEVAGEEYTERAHSVHSGFQNIQYKCNACRHPFYPPLDGTKETKDFEDPCEIILHREKSFVGALMPLYVYLNGDFITTVNNGASVEFTTNKRQNVIVITANDGTAFPDMYQFNAENRKKIEVSFKRKFSETKSS
jgi:hypothetical protein